MNITSFPEHSKWRESPDATGFLAIFGACTVSKTGYLQGQNSTLQGCFTKLRRWDGENKESAQGNEKADKLLRWQKSVKYPLQRPLFKKSVQRWDTFKYILSQKILVPIQQIHDLCVWQSNSFQYRHKSNDVVGKLPNQREVVSRSFGW